MDSRRHKSGRAEAWRQARARRPRLDCRECGAICEWLVSPWHCLKSRCPYVYSYNDCETTYFGCLGKVFSPELDLSAFADSNGEARGEADPYGPIRATRAPRLQCMITIQRVYQDLPSQGCSNPSFFRGPAGADEWRLEPGI